MKNIFQGLGDDFGLDGINGADFNIDNVQQNKTDTSKLKPIEKVHSDIYNRLESHQGVMKNNMCLPIRNIKGLDFDDYYIKYKFSEDDFHIINTPIIVPVSVLQQLERKHNGYLKNNTSDNTLVYNQFVKDFSSPEIQWQRNKGITKVPLPNLSSENVSVFLEAFPTQIDGVLSMLYITQKFGASAGVPDKNTELSERRVNLFYVPKYSLQPHTYNSGGDPLRLSIDTGDVGGGFNSTTTFSTNNIVNNRLSKSLHNSSAGILSLALYGGSELPSELNITVPSYIDTLIGISSMRPFGLLPQTTESVSVQNSILGLLDYDPEELTYDEYVSMSPQDRERLDPNTKVLLNLDESGNITTDFVETKKMVRSLFTDTKMKSIQNRKDALINSLPSVQSIHFPKNTNIELFTDKFSQYFISSGFTGLKEIHVPDSSKLSIIASDTTNSRENVIVISGLDKLEVLDIGNINKNSFEYLVRTQAYRDYGSRPESDVVYNLKHITIGGIKTFNHKKHYRMFLFNDSGSNRGSTVYNSLEYISFPDLETIETNEQGLTLLNSVMGFDAHDLSNRTNNNPLIIRLDNLKSKKGKISTQDEIFGVIRVNNVVSTYYNSFYALRHAFVSSHSDPFDIKYGSMFLTKYQESTRRTYNTQKSSETKTASIHLYIPKVEQIYSMGWLDLLTPLRLFVSSSDHKSERDKLRSGQKPFGGILTKMYYNKIKTGYITDDNGVKYRTENFRAHSTDYDLIGDITTMIRIILNYSKSTNTPIKRALTKFFSNFTQKRIREIFDINLGRQIEMRAFRDDVFIKKIINGEQLNVNLLKASKKIKNDITSDDFERVGEKQQKYILSLVKKHRDDIFTDKSSFYSSINLLPETYHNRIEFSRTSKRAFYDVFLSSFFNSFENKDGIVGENSFKMEFAYVLGFIYDISVEKYKQTIQSQDKVDAIWKRIEEITSSMNSEYITDIRKLLQKYKYLYALNVLIPMFSENNSGENLYGNELEESEDILIKKQLLSHLIPKANMYSGITYNISPILERIKDGYTRYINANNRIINNKADQNAHNNLRLYEKRYELYKKYIDEINNLRSDFLDELTANTELHQYANISNEFERQRIIREFDKIIEWKEKDIELSFGEDWMWEDNNIKEIVHGTDDQSMSEHMDKITDFICSEFMKGIDELKNIITVELSSTYNLNKAYGDPDAIRNKEKLFDLIDATNIDKVFISSSCKVSKPSEDLEYMINKLTEASKNGEEIYNPMDGLLKDYVYLLDEYVENYFTRI